MDDGSLGYPVMTARTDLNDDEWHHVACIRDAIQDSIRIFVDGVLEGSANAAGLGNLENSEPLTLGAGSPADSWFGGQLDEVRIWNVARTAEEISVHDDEAAFRR